MVIKSLLIKNILLSLLIILFSCSQNSKTIFLNNIDSLQKELDTVELETSEIKFDSIQIMYANADSIFNKTDKKDLTNEIKSLRTSYLSFLYCLKPLKWVMEEYPLMEKEILYSNQQLKALKQSISEGSVEKGKEGKFIQDEMIALQKIQQKIKDIKGQATYGTEIYLSLVDSAKLYISKTVAN